MTNMNTTNKKWLKMNPKKTLFLILGLLMILSPTLIWANTGTVLTVQGKVWLSKKNNIWIPLNQGVKIDFGDHIRTEEKSNVGILNPDGSLKRIGESVKVIYSPDSKPEEKGFFALLIDLFSSEDRTRIGGARGEGDEVLCPVNEQWINILQKETINQPDIKDIFGLAGTYDLCGKPEKTAALISMVSNHFPDNTGYKHLANKTLAKAKKQLGFDLKANWNVFVKTKKGKQFQGKKQNTIIPNSSFRIHYHAGKESYQYLFLTDTNKKDTRLVFPENPSAIKKQKQDSDFQSYVTAGRRGQIIPVKGWINFSSTESDQILWGWSCMAPVQTGIIKRKLHNLNNWLKANQSSYPFSDHLPNLCINHFYQVYSQN